MSLRMCAFIVAVALFVSLLFTLTTYALRVSRRKAQTSWTALFARLRAVNRENIARVALDLDDSTPLRDNLVELTPSEVWDLVGGMEGLLVLEANCEVLVDMASYVQRWHPEAVVVAEQLRLSAREIRWHVSRLKGAAETGKLESAFPSYGQRAVLTYYQMTRALLDLYEWTNLPEAAALKAAL